MDLFYNELRMNRWGFTVCDVRFAIYEVRFTICETGAPIPLLLQKGCPKGGVIISRCDLR